jgi:hypothetical protein
MTTKDNFKIFLLAIFALLFISCASKKNNEFKILYNNFDEEILDVLLVDRIVRDLESEDVESIRSNIDYDKQKECELFGYRLIYFLKLAEAADSSKLNSLFVDEFSDMEIDSIYAKDSLSEFARCDIILLNTSKNSIEALVLDLNEIETVDYSIKVDNLCYYPLAINEGLMLDEYRKLEDPFNMFFSYASSSGLGEKGEIYSLDRTVYKAYFEELGFVNHPEALVKVPSQCDFQTLINFYSFIINDGVVKNYSLIGNGSEVRKTDILDPFVFREMKELPRFTTCLVFVSFNSLYCFANKGDNILCVKIKLLDERYSFDFKKNSRKSFKRYPFHGSFFIREMFNLKTQDFWCQIEMDSISND